jgi:hypothetical protein
MAGLVGHAPAVGGTVAGTHDTAPGHVAASRAWHAIAARTLAWRATPGRVRLLAVASVAMAALLAAVIAVAFGAAGGSVRSIGGTDAPEVTAATGLYFSLGDMDAQVANVLLAGSDPGLAASRSSYLATYESDRENAYADLQQAAVTAAGNAAAEQQLRTVLDDVGQYEALVADALLADQQAPGRQQPAATTAGAGTSGRTSAAATGYYRQATDLMRTGILPQVSSLASVSSAKLDATYAAGRSGTGTGEALAWAAGVALVAVLAGFQVYLARRFRRRINPAIAAATLVAVVLAVTAAVRLGAEGGHLTVAKQDAFDSIVALSQARAISYNANADESRYLADPGRAGMYQASFLAESQQLASVGNVSLSGYAPALAADFRAYQANNADVRFGGYLGAEFRNITFPGERAAAVTALQAYLAYEQDDHVLRTLNVTSPQAAASYDTSMAPGQSNWAFYQYDNALQAVIGINQRAFTAAIQAGQGGAAGWDGLVPAACVLLIAGLVIIGVRPRLAEYR